MKMPQNIRDMITGNEDKRVKRFAKLVEGKSAKEKRKLEEDLLKPSQLPKYTGPEPSAQGIEGRAVRMVFPDDESFNMFRRHFSVSTYQQNSISQTQIKPLLAFIRLLDKGVLTYDPKKDKYTFRDIAKPRRRDS